MVLIFHIIDNVIEIIFSNAFAITTLIHLYYFGDGDESREKHLLIEGLTNGDCISRILFSGLLKGTAECL
jgi:hypothetical protein